MAKKQEDRRVGGGVLDAAGLDRLRAVMPSHIQRLADCDGMGGGGGIEERHRNR